MAYEQPCASYMLRQTPAAAIFAAEFALYAALTEAFLLSPTFHDLTSVFIFDYIHLKPYQIENYAYRWNYHASFAMQLIRALA